MIIDSSNLESGLGGCFPNERSHPTAQRPVPSAEIVALVRNARNGDVGAQADLVRQYQHRVTGLVLKILRRRNVIEDVVQTIMIRMVRRLPRLRQPEVFESWLFRMARNESFDFLRRAKCRPTTFADEWDWLAMADSADDHSHRQIEEAADHAIRALGSTFERRLIRMVIAGHSYDAIATQTGLTSNAVKIRIHRIRLVLRPKMLEALGETTAGQPA